MSAANTEKGKRRFKLHGTTATSTNWPTRHIQSALFSLGRLFEKPTQSLLTAAVIGIALSLPSVAMVLLSKVQAVSSGMGTVKVSVFCDVELNNQQAKALAAEFELRDDIKQVRFISKEEAREEFRLHSGFGEAIDLVGKDVLPATIVVQPIGDTPSPAQVKQLAEDLRSYQGVDIVQLDQRWLEKLFNWLELIQIAVTIFGLLLGMAVIVIVGNTIRLEINNRSEEIEVVKLVGATDAFVRRPFLYMGLWQGLAGGMIALVLVLVALLFIGDSIDALADSYNRNVDLGLFELGTLIMIIVGGMLLGWLGSWLAVGQHLRRIQPS